MKNKNLRDKIESQIQRIEKSDVEKFVYGTIVAALRKSKGLLVLCPLQDYRPLEIFKEVLHRAFLIDTLSSEYKSLEKLNSDYSPFGNVVSVGVTDKTFKDLLFNLHCNAHNEITFKVDLRDTTFRRYDTLVILNDDGLVMATGKLVVVKDKEVYLDSVILRYLLSEDSGFERLPSVDYDKAKPLFELIPYKNVEYLEELKSKLKQLIGYEINNIFNDLGVCEKAVERTYIGYKFIKSLDNLDYTEEILESLIAEYSILDFLFDFVGSYENIYGIATRQEDFQVLIDNFSDYMSLTYCDDYEGY